MDLYFQFVSRFKILLMAKAYPSKPFNSQNLVQKLFNLMTTRAKVWKAAKENVLNLKDANELKSLDQQFYFRKCNLYNKQ
ncbi:MAG: hypothetical protein ACJAZ3_001693 [Sphingobacteriales bacterium]|jgi:hypothetical protein